MTHLIPSLLLSSLLLVSLPARALQILDARDGETVFAKISQKEVTRIAFERGRVRKVTGNTGEFVLEKDEDRGQVFIRPTVQDRTKPINIFLSSERGTVALLLQPVDVPSDSLIIREGAEPRAPGAGTERDTRHVRVLKNLLLAMAGDTLPEDMEIREPGREFVLRPGIRLILNRLYLGAGIVGERYQLANVGSTEVSLSERELFRSGVMAVSLERAKLGAGEATNVFVIRERKPND